MLSLKGWDTLCPSKQTKEAGNISQKSTGNYYKAGIE